MIPLRIISNRSQGERELLKLIQVEFLKLRRRKFIWLMLLAALFMPLAAVFYFSSVKGTGVDPIMFYKWTAFSYTPWIILPVVLGMLCTMLMYNETSMICSNSFGLYRSINGILFQQVCCGAGVFHLLYASYRNGVHSDQHTIRLYSL